MQIRHVVLAASLVVIAACGSDSTNESGSADVGPLAWTAERSERASYDRSYESLPELIRQIGVHSESIDGPPQNLVVRGRVTSVEPGPGFDWIDEGDSGEFERRTVANSDGTVATYVLTFEVTDVIAPFMENRLSEPLRVGFVVAPDVTAGMVERDFLTTLGEAVLFLHRSDVHDYEPDLWAVMGSGQLLAKIAADGSLSFPASASEELVTAGTPVSVDDLSRAASG